MYSLMYQYSLSFSFWFNFTQYFLTTKLMKIPVFLKEVISAGYYFFHKFKILWFLKSYSNIWHSEWMQMLGLPRGMIEKSLNNEKNPSNLTLQHPVATDKRYCCLHPGCRTQQTRILRCHYWQPNMTWSIRCHTVRCPVEARQHSWAAESQRGHPARLWQCRSL